MPPVRIKREDIIKGTIKYIREKGIENLSARTLAKSIKCSTQPIFKQFINMEDLKQTVFTDIFKLHKSILEKGKDKHDIPFIGIGLAYIDFAKKEPNLFRFLFLSPNTKSNNILDMVESKEGEEYINLIKSTTGLPDDLSKQIYINLWLIIHGIACMVSTSNSTITESECETILVDAFKGYRQVLMNKALNSVHLKK